MFYIFLYDRLALVYRVTVLQLNWQLENASIQLFVYWIKYLIDNCQSKLQVALVYILSLSDSG